MLLQFNFQNYKSFKNETTLNMWSSSSSELNGSLIKIADEKILPLANIFGANAHGKSNIIEALKYMQYNVLTSSAFSEVNSNILQNNFSQRFVPPKPFLFDKESKNRESTFEVYFLNKSDEKIYNYGFTMTAQGIGEEWLNIKKSKNAVSKQIFYRNEAQNEFNISKSFGILKELLLKVINKNTLIISFGYLFKIAECENVYEWFQKLDIIDLANDIFSLNASNVVSKELIENEKARNELVTFLNCFDDSIKGFEVKKIDLSEQKQKIELFSKHQINDSDDMMDLDFSDESQGTIRMYSLYKHIKNAIDNGSVLCIDEVNSKLHPMLIKRIIDMFNNPKENINNAQLIFTSHDLTQLEITNMRRDQIWFVEKNEQQVSELYSLANIELNDGSKVRKDTNYFINYFNGKFGAIPKLKPFWIKENNQ